MLTIDLPEPPGVNQLFTKDRHISKVYRQWRRDAGWELKSKKLRPVPGKYTALIELYEKTRKDVDACAKAILDLLVRHKITDDDRHCNDVRQIKTGTVNGRCRVTVSEWVPA